METSHIAYEIKQRPEYSLKIEETNDNGLQMYIKCTHWMDKDWKKVGPSFSKAFTHHEIMTDHDVVSQLYAMTGLKRQVIWTY